MYLIPIIIVSILIILCSFVVYYRRKKHRSVSEEKPVFTKNTSKNKDNFTFITCPRCHKYNYVDKQSLVKICSSCGWNLTEPYIYTTFCLDKAEVPLESSDLLNLKVNEEVFVIENSDSNSNKKEGRNTLAVFSKNGKIIGWLPDHIMDELMPKIALSKRILAKVKRIYADSGEVEIVITNDLLKMWS